MLTNNSNRGGFAASHTRRMQNPDVFAEDFRKFFE